jgi:hypothetical protein
VDADRLASFHKLRRELAHLEARQDEMLAGRERSHSRTATKALRSHLNHKYG